MLSRNELSILAGTALIIGVLLWTALAGKEPTAEPVDCGPSPGCPLTYENIAASGLTKLAAGMGGDTCIDLWVTECTHTAQRGAGQVIP